MLLEGGQEFNIFDNAYFLFVSINKLVIFLVGGVSTYLEFGSFAEYFPSNEELLFDVMFFIKDSGYFMIFYYFFSNLFKELFI